MGKNNTPRHMEEEELAKVRELQKRKRVLKKRVDSLSATSSLHFHSALGSTLETTQRPKSSAEFGLSHQHYRAMQNGW